MRNPFLVAHFIRSRARCAQLQALLAVLCIIVIFIHVNKKEPFALQMTLWQG